MANAGRSSHKAMMELDAPSVTDPSRAPHPHSLPSSTALHSDTREGSKDTVGDKKADSREGVDTSVKSTQPVASSEWSGGGDGMPLSREHNLDQDQVDYSIDDEEEDLVPTSNPTHAKGSAPAETDKPQKPKISWREWANADGIDHARHASEKKDGDGRRDSHIMEAPRGPHDQRRNRDDGRRLTGRFPRKDPPRSRLESHPGRRENDRDRSPNRRPPFKTPHMRSNEASPFRRGYPGATQAGMPPGMHYGKPSAGSHVMRSGPVDSSRSLPHPSSFRGMPPGLGVSGPGPGLRAASRSAEQGPPPAQSHRGVPSHSEHGARGRSPVHHDRPPRTMSPGRYGRRSRPHSSPRLQEPLPSSPVNRPRSPVHNGPPPYPDRNGSGGQRPMQRRRHPINEEDGSPVACRQRTDNPPSFRARDTVPASPRRFTLPEKRPPNARQSNPPPMERPYHHVPSGNVARHAAMGGWSHQPQHQPPPRSHPRRAPSPNFDRPGGMRRSPPPVPTPQSTRRLQREPSPPQPERLPPPPHHRDVDPSLRRRDEPGRPDHVNGDRDRRPPHGMRAESEPERRVPMSVAGRYGDHGRDPPPSPIRNVKRQRQSPPEAEQRFRRDPLNYRSAAKIPHENPPNTDGMPRMVMRHPENECAWYYVDPQGNTQGPCTIAQFRSWLRTLAEDPKFADEHKQFMSVDVWKEGVQKKQLMTELLENNVP